MSHGTINSRHSGFHRQIADILRREPVTIRVLASRLREEIVKAGSSHAMDTAYMEWYAILTLWPKSEVIRLLEDPGEEDLLRINSDGFNNSGLCTTGTRSSDKTNRPAISEQRAHLKVSGNSGFR